MEDFLVNSSPNHEHFSNFSYSEGDGFRHTCRHNGMQYDKSKKLQTENEYLKEKVRSNERGLGKLYQIIVNYKKQPNSPRSINHNRSASGTYQYNSHSLSPSPTLESCQFNGSGIDVSSPLPQVSMAELQICVEKLLSERESLLSIVDDLKQITEAAKRERVLAIDEKDLMLRETHSLKVTIDTTQRALANVEVERDILKDQMLVLQDNLASLKRDNEKAKEMRSLALEERSKIIAECSELQHELHNFQTEREELYGETLQLQSQLDKLVGEKRKLLQDLDWLSKKSSGYENVTPQMLKEQSEPLPSGKCYYDVIEVDLNRMTPEQPWGFTIEGGRGTEFYHQDPSIVVTGVANHTPASDSLRFGDRVFSFGESDFRNITRKEAAEFIRSCDVTAVSMEIGRASANIKPAPQEVRIPGKKDFGFSYESRLFVTSAEEGSIAAESLMPGDEIVLVQGKSAFNMKPSSLKQLLKSCKDGVTLTVQRQPGINLSSFSSTSIPRPRKTSLGSRSQRDIIGHDSLPLQNGGKPMQPQRLSSELVPSPGTPKSTISESSAGYHSLTHSMPSELSNNNIMPVKPFGLDSRTGHASPEQEQIHFENRRPRYLSDSSSASCEPTSPHYKMRSMSSNVVSGLNRSSYRNRPADYYPPRRHTSTATTYSSPFPKSATGLRARARSTNTYRSGFRSDHMSQYPKQQKVANHMRGTRPITTTIAENRPFSMSADNLDSETCVPADVTDSAHRSKSHDTTPQSSREVHGKVVTPVTSPTSNYSRGHLSMSMGNMQTHV